MSIKPGTDLATDEVADKEELTDRGSFSADATKELENREAVTPRPADAGKTTPLFPENEATKVRNRWTEIQTAFVDEPRRAVEQADALVTEVIERLSRSFADERSKLEGQWGRGDNVSTEDLRVALQRYRAFFDRLLSV